MLQEFGLECNKPMNMYCDNQSAIFIVNNPVFYERMKNIKEAITNNLICMSFTR